MIQHIKKYFSYYSGVCIIVVACLVAGGIFIKNPATVYSGQVHLGSATVISPKPPTVESYEAGSLVDFSVRYNFVYCGNATPTARGKMTQPVPVDQPHTAFGPERLSDTLVGSRRRDSELQYRYRFDSTYTQRFIAPTTPGIYKFRYQVGARNAQRTDRFFSGEVRFLVRARDICTNIDGLQETVPANHYGTTNSSGESICLNDATSNLICTVDNSPIVMGNMANFSARMRNETRGTFSWYEGQMTAGSPVKRDSGVLRSSYSKFYTTPGVYQTTVLFSDERGDRQECVVGVRVYPNEETNTANPGTTVFGFLNPNASPAELNFAFENELTNTTCRSSWSATNVLGCQLYKGSEFLRDVEPEGTLDLEPGSYKLTCVQVKDGSMVSSNVAMCRKNIDSREI